VKDDLIMSLMPGDVVINIIELKGDHGSKIKPGEEFNVIATDGNDCILTRNKKHDDLMSVELFMSKATSVKIIKEVMNLSVERLGGDYDPRRSKKDRRRRK